MLGRIFSRKELEVMTETNSTAIEDLTERVAALENYLKIKYDGCEYAKAPVKRGRKTGATTKKPAKKTEKTK